MTLHVIIIILLLLSQNNIKSVHKRNPSAASIFMAEVEDHYEVLNVAEDCSLRNFIENNKGLFSYDKGCSYYELTDKEVDIDSSKEVILMDKVSSKLWI